MNNIVRLLWTQIIIDEYSNIDRTDVSRFARLVLNINVH